MDATFTKAENAVIKLCLKRAFFHHRCAHGTMREIDEHLALREAYGNLDYRLVRRAELAAKG